MSKNIFKIEKVEKNGRPYWIVLLEGTGGPRVEGYVIEWHIRDESFAGEYLGNGRDFDKIVDRYRSEMYKARFEKEIAQEKVKEGSTNKSSHSGFGNEKESSSYCVKLIFTIIPVLPIWYVIKLPFCLGWGIIKSIGYIVSWPFRLIMCCCCSTQLLPDNAINWPRYDF